MKLGFRCAALALALASACVLPARAEAAPWLFVSDIHLDPRAQGAEPSPGGSDTNEALLRSAIAEMRRVDPAPPVVVIPGDFLGHNFDRRYAHATMAHVADLFGRAFPNAQFVVAMGNEDSACGDYVAAPDAPYLADTAAVWEPLVNRRGAAADFRSTFSRDGFYTVKLPVPGLRAVVLDDTFWSPLFRLGCGSTAGDGGAEELADLDRALPPGNPEKSWVLLHIPPGIDAGTTVHLTHRLAVVPFLDGVPRDRLLAILGDRRRNVALAISGHTHKFAFRLVGAESPEPVPLLLVPALSPIFRNAPMFLTVDVEPTGTIRRIEEHAFDGKVWRDEGGSKDLGLREFTGPELSRLRRRLEGDPGLLAAYARLYEGGANSEITAGNARGYLCAIDAMNSNEYRGCVGEGGYRFLTGRGVFVVACAGALVLLGLILATGFIVRRLSPR